MGGLNPSESEQVELSVACRTCMRNWGRIRPGSNVQERARYAYELGLRHVGERHKMDAEPRPIKRGVNHQ